MTEEDREFGNLGARVGVLEREVEKLRVRAHDQAQKLTVYSNVLAAAKILSRRLGVVEKFQTSQARMIGIAAGIGAVLGAIASFVAEKLLGR